MRWLRGGFVALVLVLLVGVAPVSAQGPQTAQEPEGELLDALLDSLLNTPVQTASKYEQASREAPADITIVTAEDIRRYGYRTLEDVFRNTRGFFVSYDRTYSYVGARGFGRPGDFNNRILVLVDGHTLNEGFSGGVRTGTAATVDLDDVQRIEIVHGPGSALYGTRAMLAVVNMITKDGRSVDGGEATGAVGSLNSKRIGAVLGRETDGGVDYFLSGNFAESNGEERLYFPEFDDGVLSDGVAEDLDWGRLARAHGVLSYRGLRVHGAFASRDKGIPTAWYGTQFNAPSAQTRDQSAFAEVSYEVEPGRRTRLTARGFYDHYHNHGTYPNEVTVHSHIKSQAVGGEVRGLWEPFMAHRLIVGVEAQRHFEARIQLRTDFGEPPPQGQPYTLGSVYVQDEWQITEHLSTTLGLRGDFYSTAGSAVNPRLAVVYHPWPSTSFKALYGEAFRAPNILELYVSQPTANIIANPDLEPERIRTAELLWQQRVSAPVALGASVYRSDIRGLIDQVPIESANPSDSRLHQYRNRGRARATGADVELAVADRSGWSGEGSVGLQSVEDPETKERLSNSPARVFKARMGGPVAAWLTLGATFVAESERITISGTKTAGFALFGLSLGSGSLWDRVTAEASIHNLFDVDYALPGGFQHAQVALQQPGRRVAVRLRANW
jgi:iron complex outermembrane receptor protein